MAEAEEVLQDVARHATVFVRDLWRRHRPPSADGPAVTLKDIASRLDLLLTAAFGRSFSLRLAEAPPPATLLMRVMRRGEGPRRSVAVPATDGTSIWCPAPPALADEATALSLYRLMALRQAMRAVRGSPFGWAQLSAPMERAFFLLQEAHAADAALLREFPGTAAALRECRQRALAQRPPVAAFPAYRRDLEALLRQLLQADLSQVAPLSVAALVKECRAAAARTEAPPKALLLLEDEWTGQFRIPSMGMLTEVEGGAQSASDLERPAPRSARLPRSPDVRESAEDEDDASQGAWMVQTSQPMEQAEDPFGLQRPTDRDESTAAEELADSLSELPEARLVSTPGRPKEVLLSENAPERQARLAEAAASGSKGELQLRYPEWDFRLAAYRENAVTVHLTRGAAGSPEWVERTLASHAGLLHLVRRRFEMLKAQRMRRRKQVDGDDIDLEAYIEAQSDFRAGLPMPERLYQSTRNARRDMAALILVDVSGSTDGWVSAGKRVVDVEREALLLVSVALDGMGERFALQAFSGEGPAGVVVRRLKDFDEPYDEPSALRIAAIEPEHYTRTGAAIRHATATLLREPARHRLLLLLSDGKPNDVDVYEGRYGVEDMRQAVVEGRLQGVESFCLTIDRQAAGYLADAFGPHQYALLPRPELLPTVLLQWMKRLVQA